MASRTELERARKSVGEFTSEMYNLLGKMSAEGHVSQPDDIYVVTLPKAGTNLMRQMVYQIVHAAGSMPLFDTTGEDFELIDHVAPLLEAISFIGVRDGVANPRIYATHLFPDAFNVKENGRYIYVVRDVETVPASMLDFMVNWVSPDIFNSPQERELFYHEYVKKIYLGLTLDDESGVYKRENAQLGNWFKHVKAWTQILTDNVLVLFYEKVVKDPRGSAKRIADFLGLEIGEQGLDKVVKRCSREYMRNCNKFRVPFPSPPSWKGQPNGFVRKEGDTGFHAFKFDQQAKDICSEMMQDAFGTGSYKEFMDKLTAKHTTG